MPQSSIDKRIARLQDTSQSNKERVAAWIKRNPERWREIQRNSRNKRRTAFSFNIVPTTGLHCSITFERDCGDFVVRTTILSKWK